MGRSFCSSTSCIRSSARGRRRGQLRLEYAEAGAGAGELRAIGATTLNEYRKLHREGRGAGAALPDRLRGEPNVEDTIAILRGLKERYESHHKVRVRDSAIVAAATLSHRYISDRFLPGQGD